MFLADRLSMPKTPTKPRGADDKDGAAGSKPGTPSAPPARMPTATPRVVPRDTKPAAPPANHRPAAKVRANER